MNNLQCPECGKELTDGERICNNCGFPLQEPIDKVKHRWCCVNCGEMTDSSICPYCGQSSTEKQTDFNMPSMDIGINDTIIENSTKSHKKLAILLICSIVFISVITALSISVISAVIRPSIKYNHAKELLQNKDYISAFSVFEELGNYRDAEDLAQKAQMNVCYTLSIEDIIKVKTKTQIKDATIEFAGNDWSILTIEGDKALLLSNEMVTYMPYNEQNTEVTWENCDLRKYLNEDYYKTISTEERAMIVPVENKNSDNADYNSKGGSTTTDKVFLLSLQEANTYSESLNSYASVSSSWWLRSPGKTNGYAACVTEYYDILNKGFEVTRSGNGVRPALWIRISSIETVDKVLKQLDFSTESGTATVSMGGNKWRILDVAQDKILILADEIIEKRPFHISYEQDTYAKSDIREYLNGDFLNCFTGEEKLRITVHDAELGKAFLLSAEEVRTYFGDDSQYDKPIQSYEDLYYDYDKFVRDGIRARKIAEYKGVDTDWWLRDIGYETPYVVTDFGATHTKTDYDIAGIRPAMWVKLIDTEYSQTPVSINNDFLLNIDRTYGEMVEKYGEVTEAIIGTVADISYLKTVRDYIFLKAKMRIWIS